jgi:hypothetical protein
VWARYKSQSKKEGGKKELIKDKEHFVKIVEALE